MPYPSPVLRDTKLPSVLELNNFPNSTGAPIVSSSIQTGVDAYLIQTPLNSVLAIAQNFPGT